MMHPSLDRESPRPAEPAVGPVPSGLDLIGGTPLLHLARLWHGPGRLLAKAEFLQPGGSVKDRAAKWIVLHARQTGLLRAGQPVVEMTSGNMGAGLALVCSILGHPFTAVMSAGNSVERERQMRALGAEVVRVPQVDGAPGQVTGEDIAAAERFARAHASRQGGFYVDQFHNEGSVLAHEEGTGPEVWHGVRGRLDAFVAAVGSGGTFVGTSRFLKRQSNLRCFAVEPQSSAVLSGRAVTNPRHIIQGIGYGLVPPHWDDALCDRVLTVSDEETAAMTQRLAQREGLLVGYSSGANVAAALKLLAQGELPSDATVVTVLCDSGLKYAFDWASVA